MKVSAKGASKEGAAPKRKRGRPKTAPAPEDDPYAKFVEENDGESTLLEALAVGAVVVS